MEEKEASWIKHYWRPAIAYQYLAVCLCDFILFPILNGMFFAVTGIPFVPWEPLTLKESGFYHMSMGAIIGVAAWTRGQEKIIRRKLYGEEEYESTPTRQEPR